MNETINTIKSRRSVRVYTGKEISREKLEEIISCARMAPSANNRQPWEFIVVTDKEMLRKLGEVCTYGNFIKDAAACIVVCGDESNKHILEDGSAATQNILLAAKSLGIGSCWVAGWQRDYNNLIKETLEMPHGFSIVSILSLGYPKEAKYTPKKRELSDVLHWEVF